MDELTPQEIDKAYERIFSLIIKTPLISSETINKKNKCQCLFQIRKISNGPALSNYEEQVIKFHNYQMKKNQEA